MQRNRNESRNPDKFTTVYINKFNSPNKIIDAANVAAGIE